MYLLASTIKPKAKMFTVMTNHSAELLVSSRLLFMLVLCTVCSSASFVENIKALSFQNHRSLPTSVLSFSLSPQSNSPLPITESWYSPLPLFLNAFCPYKERVRAAKGSSKSVAGAYHLLTFCGGVRRCRAKVWGGGGGDGDCANNATPQNKRTKIGSGRDERMEKHVINMPMDFSVG